MPHPPFLLLGQVLRPHGVRGEVRVAVQTAYPERLVDGTRVYVGPDPENVATAAAHTVRRVRPHRDELIIDLDGIPDRSAADTLREQYIMIPIDSAVPLEEGEYYLFQLIDMTVVTVDGETLGKVDEVIETGANDVFVVHGPRGEVLVPDIDECVLDIDFDTKTITIDPLEGLF
jgi:16S rRNA processing protein RimM